MKNPWDVYIASLADEVSVPAEFSRERWQRLSETGLFAIPSPFDQQLNSAWLPVIADSHFRR